MKLHHINTVDGRTLRLDNADRYWDVQQHSWLSPPSETFFGPDYLQQMTQKYVEEYPKSKDMDQLRKACLQLEGKLMMTARQLKATDVIWIQYPAAVTGSLNQMVVFALLVFLRKVHVALSQP